MVSKFNISLEKGNFKVRKILLDFLEHLITELNPYNIVKNCANLVEDFLVIKGKKVRIKGDVYIVGIGKASYFMTKAILEILGNKVKDYLIITKKGYVPEDKELEAIESDHPYPSTKSYECGKKLIDFVEKVDEKSTLIFLISGGASSLVIYPEDEISVKDKIDFVKTIINSGMNIKEINALRKHVSKIKGGKLLKRIKSKVISLVISDVIGDDLEVIASGITYKDSSTFKQCVDILKKYKLESKIPESILDYLNKGNEETLKEVPSNVQNFLLFGHRDLLNFSSKYFKRIGINPYPIMLDMSGNSRVVGDVIGRIVKCFYKEEEFYKRPLSLIFTGETYVNVKNDKGKGGPNQELVLSALKHLKDLENVGIMAIDTDGTDGPTDACGGIVDNEIAKIVKERRINIEQYLEENNSYEILEKLNCLIKTGPTYNNLNSLVVSVIL